MFDLSDEENRKLADTVAEVFNLAKTISQSRLRTEFENATMDIFFSLSDETISYWNDILSLTQKLGFFSAEQTIILNDARNCLEKFSFAPHSKDAHHALSDAYNKDRNSDIRQDDNTMVSGSADISAKDDMETAKQPLSKLLSHQIRQLSILDKIRGLDNFQLKDIVGALPDFSERMIRYELQKLCEQGALERKGGSGVSSFYSVLKKHS